MGEMEGFLRTLGRILERDVRYKHEAYFFVMEALDRAVKALKEPRHLTGGELLEAIRRRAESEYGPMAVTVFRHWGIKNSLDFGFIVFNMVQEGILSKTDTDTLEDFRSAAFFETLFDASSAYRLADEESSQQLQTN